MPDYNNKRDRYMGQKEKIIEQLKTNGAMTQSALAMYIYEGKSHSQAIYSSLMKLVEDGIVNKIGSNPASYTWTGKEIDSPEKKTSKKEYRDVSGDVITNETVEESELLVQKTNNYGRENELITRCLKRFPENTDSDIIAMKIGLIDITNSTHLSQHKSKISMAEFAEIIAKIPGIDSRIKRGDPEVVNEIARSNGKINLFSFASKYCCYHNRNLYDRDDYSIFDTVLMEYLPRYFGDITENKIKKWKEDFDYNTYNEYITQKLNEYGITLEYRKRKFDHFVWYKNRNYIV